MATKPSSRASKPAPKRVVKSRSVPAKAAPVVKAEAKPVEIKKPAVVKAVEAVSHARPEVMAPERIVAPAIEIGETEEVKSNPPIAAQTASEGTRPMTDTVKQVEETLKKTTAEATEKATAMFNDMNARAKTAMEKAGAVSKDVVEFHKGNLEAVVEAGKIAAKGAQTVAQNAADYGRKNFEATTTMFKSVAAIKSPTDLFKLQGDFARSQFDGAVAEMSKSTEFGLKLAGEIFQPIQSRYAVVAEGMKTRLAA